MTDTINKSVKTAHFEKDGCRFMLTKIDEYALREIIRDPETGMERWINGYPQYFTPTGILYPIPVEGIEVIYG